MTDSQGNVVSMVVTVDGGDPSTTQALVEAINENVQKGNECTIGMLCRATSVFIDSMRQPSSQPRVLANNLLLLCMLLLGAFRHPTNRA